MPKKLPPQAYLRECFDYHPETGVLIWRQRPRSHFKSDGTWRMFNRYYPGQSALSYAGTDRSRWWTVTIIKRNFYAHRIIWKWMTGEEPHEIDHKNTDGADNRWGNLRAATRFANTANTKRRLTNTFPKGVTSNHKRFSAALQCRGERFYLGTFDTPTEAHAAYCTAARKHFGEFWNPG